jgi:anti-sigma B factor antagonist
MGASPLLSLSLADDGDWITVVAVGEVEISSAVDLEARLDQLWQSGRDCVDLDLSKVSFMDSTGLRVLIRTVAHATATESTFRIVAASDEVRRLLRLTGMDAVLPVRPRSVTAPAAR